MAFTYACSMKMEEYKGDKFAEVNIKAGLGFAIILFIMLLVIIIAT